MAFLFIIGRFYSRGERPSFGTFVTVPGPLLLVGSIDALVGLHFVRTVVRDFLWALVMDPCWILESACLYRVYNWYALGSRLGAYTRGSQDFLGRACRVG